MYLYFKMYTHNVICLSICEYNYNTHIIFQEYSCTLCPKTVYGILYYSVFPKDSTAAYFITTLIKENNH